MKSFTWINIIALAAALGFTPRCTNNNDTLAGGAGVGNPVTPVGFAIEVSDIDTVSKKTLKKVLLDKGNPGDITIHDESAGVFTVTSAKITVDRVEFLQEGYAEDDTSGEDSKRVLFNGPFTFDAITGIAQPAFGSYAVQSGEYRGVKLHINKKDAQELEVAAIEIGGTFNYQGKERTFSFNLQCNLSATYLFSQRNLELVPDTPQDIVLVLDANQWLEGINIIHCLDEHYLFLGDDGSLVINNRVPPGPCHSSENVIRKNVKNSGRLLIEN